MKVRFLADADLNVAIVNGVLRREPSIDFLIDSSGLRGRRDDEVLRIAAENQRILVSHDVGTMPSHLRRFREAGNRSAGVILVSQGLSIGAAIEDLLLVSFASEAGEWVDRIEWLPL